MEEMEASLRVVSEEITGLDTRKNALLAQLAQVEAALAQAHAQRADLEESRNVYEEGIAFSMDALQHQARSVSCLTASHIPNGVHALARLQTLCSHPAYKGPRRCADG
jgi:ABC-type transporter Mla MlaB component